jgi:serine/threonine protein kinase
MCDDQKLYAMKIMRKDKYIKKNLMKYAQSEKDTLSTMKHPFIVKLNYAF